MCRDGTSVSMRRREGIPLAPYTTFGIGGPAAALVELTVGQQVGPLVEELAADADLHVIGGGSNVLVSDRGLPGTTVVMRHRTGRLQVEVDADGLVRLDGAWDWPSVTDLLAEEGIQGTEALCGIPGTVGGAVVQNVGAYGHELVETIHEVEVFDRVAGRRLVLEPSECAFGYRTSRFKSADRGRYVVLAATLRLRPGGAHEVRYEELGRELGAGRDAPNPAEVRRAVLRIRERKSMVYHPGDPATRGVGSFFTNPEVGRQHFEALLAGRGEHRHVPHWPAGEDHVKLSAGWLVEHAGFRKGQRSGNVGLSPRHALAILNVTGEATADEVIGFARSIRRRVYEVHGIHLIPEPVLMGFPEDPWG